MLLRKGETCINNDPRETANRRRDYEISLRTATSGQNKNKEANGGEIGGDYYFGSEEQIHLHIRNVDYSTSIKQCL